MLKLNWQNVQKYQIKIFQMKLTSSKLPLVLFVFALVILGVSCQCCLQFRNNQCVQCPTGMHLFRANCIYDLPNCQSYIGGFSCGKCKTGFVFDQQNQCIPQQINNLNQVPIFGNSLVEPIVYRNDQYYLAAFSNARSQLSTDLGNSYLVQKVYFSQRTGQIWSVRIIFQTANGFLDALYAFNSRSLTIAPILVSKRSFLLSSEEKFINFETDSNFNAIRAQISNQYPNIASYNFLAAAKSSSQKDVFVYRIFYIDPNAGLLEIKVLIQKAISNIQTVIPAFSNGQEVFTLSALETVPQFALGYQLFKDIQEVRGSQVSKLSRRFQNNMYIYIITFTNRQNGKILEASYNIDQQNDRIQFVGINQVNTSIDSSTSTPTVFRLTDTPRVILNAQQYSNDVNFQRVSRFLQSNTDLSRFSLGVVTREIKGGVIRYSVTYQNANELIIYDTIFDPSTNSVKIQGTAKSARQNTSTPIPPANKPVSTPVNAPANTPVNTPRTQLTPEQYQSDLNFQVVRTFLQSNRNLLGYNMTIVFGEVKNGVYLYLVVFQNKFELIIYNAKFDPATKKVEIESTSSRPLPKVQNNKDASVSQLTVKPVPEPVPQPMPQPVTALISQSSSYKLKSNQNNVLISQFTANNPNEAAYVTKINSDLFANAAIERIVYSSSSKYWKFFLTSGLYYTLVQQDNNTFTITEIVPLNSQTMINFLSASERAQIDQALKFSSPVTSAQGSWYPINNGAVTYYRLLVTLQNNRKYQVELLGEGSSRNNYRLLSYRISNQQTVPSFNFRAALSQIPLSVQTFMLNNFNVRSIESVQVDSNVPTVYRVLFMTSWGMAQVIYNSNLNFIYSYDLVSAGFRTLPSIPTSNIYSNAEKLVANYCKLSNYKIAAVKQRTWTGVVQYAIFFETASGTYKAIIMYNSVNQRYYFNVFTSKPSGIGEQEKIPSIFSNSQSVDTTKALGSSDFVAAQNLLIKQYPQFLVQPRVRSIFTKNEGQNIVVYEVIYDTTQGTFLAVLNYNRQTNTPAIKSLVLTDFGRVGLIISGCLNLDTNQQNCLRCAEGYNLGQDKFCYKNIENCLFSSGNMCLACSGNNLLIANQCTSQCGPYCRPNVYPYLGSPFDFKCSIFNDSTGKCSFCKSGFSIDKNFGSCISTA